MSVSLSDAVSGYPEALLESAKAGGPESALETAWVGLLGWG